MSPAWRHLMPSARPCEILTGQKGVHVDQVVGDSLALVNIVRASYGQEPLTELPDASRGNASDCLFYRALQDVGVESVGGLDMVWKDERVAQTVGQMWGVPVNGRSTANPTQMRKVISAFDNSNLPQYNLR